MRFGGWDWITGGKGDKGHRGIGTGEGKERLILYFNTLE